MVTYLPDIPGLEHADALLVHIDSAARIGGPGDALRFVHALHVLTSLGCISTVRCLVLQSELARLAGLFSGESIAVNNSVQDGVVTWFSDPAAENAVEQTKGKLLGLSGLNTFLRALGDSDHAVLHAHLGRGLSHKTHVGTLVRGRSVRSRVQIDANSLLGARRISLPLPSLPARNECARQLRVGIFLRQVPARSPARIDAPEHFLRYVSRIRDIRRVWFGLKEDKVYRDIRWISESDEMLPFGQSSYLEQAANLRQLDGAIGYNSGGLDLASAAGIPTLRLGEYQRLGRGARSGSGSKRRVKAWGATYNSFLAVATNIGVEPARPSAQVIKTAIEHWLELLASGVLKAPHHFIVDDGAELSPSKFRNRLSRFTHSDV